MANRPDTTYAFGFNQKVKLVASYKVGSVVGRSEFTDARNKYLVRCVAADGQQIEVWWPEDAIVAA